MVASSANEAVANANRYTTNRPGMCLQYVRTWLEIPAGNPDAIAAWNNATRKHVQGRDKDAQSPPRGAPVFWRGGSAGHGHIALAITSSTGRSTDTPGVGRVSTQDGDWWRQHWNMPYLGWTEDLNGVTIPWLRDGGRSEWAGGLVLVAKLHRDQKNSDSVARLCYRLMHNVKIPKERRPPQQVRGYGPKITAAVRYWQNEVRPKVDGPKDGRSLSNKQANVMFGKNYDVVEK
jgi:hypothetical protein